MADLPVYRHLVSCAKGLVDSNQIAVLADKDPKRRVIMSRKGYLYRLAKGFLLDFQFFEIPSIWVAKVLEILTSRSFKKCQCSQNRGAHVIYG